MTKASGPARHLAAVLILGIACTVGCTKKTEPAALLADNNVILVLVDTLRADHLGTFGYQWPTSPFLDQLVAESITFDRAVAPASQTVPSMLSLWTGVYPNRHGNEYYAGARAFRVPTPRTKPRVPDNLTMMSEHLARRGYRTGAIVTNPWLREDYGFARGFETYRHWDSVPAPRGPVINAAAREQVTKWKEERFFLYLHYMDVHIPLDPKPRYREDFPIDPGLVLGLAALKSSYDAEIRAVDDYVKDLVKIVRDLGIEDKTLLVFVSDHGEEFGDHGRLGHGHSLYQELVHVPLLFRHPRLKSAARRIDTPVSLVDIAPTILELTLGKTSTDSNLDGVSLVPLLRGEDNAGKPRTLFTELGEMTAAIRNDKKLIRSHKKEAPEQWAYDLRIDPSEKTATSAGEPWVEKLSTAIDDHEARRVVDDESKDSIDPVTEERVRALGY